VPYTYQVLMPPTTKKMIDQFSEYIENSKKNKVNRNSLVKGLNFRQASHGVLVEN
jgi:thermostable 8-oxoguanine DNA glycosylase